MQFRRGSALLSATLALTLSTLVRNAAAQLITAVDEGHNIIAKLPCVGCPLFVRDDKSGAWNETAGESALLLHISLTHASTSLRINNADLLTPSSLLPRVTASQIPLDAPISDTQALLTTLRSEDDNNNGNPTFGLSYTYSLHHLTDYPALLFRFNVLSLWPTFSTTSSAGEIALDTPAQQVVELVLLKQPVLGCGDQAPLYSIVRAGVVERDGSVRSPRAMRWEEWDAHGRKGTVGRFVRIVWARGVGWVSESVMGLCVFVFACMGMFVVLSLFCIFGCGFWRDEYQQAQLGKGDRTLQAGMWDGDDVEKVKTRFLSANELGLRSGGTVVGVGKRD